jgi:uncharacterized phage infection (PIP) family protein YhgE
MSAKKSNTQSARTVRDRDYIASRIARGDTPADIKPLWEHYITELARGGEKIDVNELIQFVLSESYLETNRDLQFYAEKVKYYNEMKKQVHDETQRLRDIKQELDARISSLEEKLNSIGDDAQLANVDLQNILQKQQQTLQMMSNISKMLYDTALAVIRKIGG